MVASMPRLPIRHDWSQVVLLLRERRQESQAEFAGTLGCSLSSVSKWERGEAVPGPRHRRRMEALGEALGLPSSEWPENRSRLRLI